MKNINVCLLAAVACTYSMQATANSLDKNLNFILNDNVISLHGFKTATHEVMPLELNPVNISDRAVKLAGVCSITDPSCIGFGFGGDKDKNNDFNLDYSKQCKEDGYMLSLCPLGNQPADLCPHNSNYFKTCCPNAVSEASCSFPQVVDQTCGGKVSCKCSAEFAYNTNNCPSPKILGGDSCTYKADGAVYVNYTQCSCPSDYTETCASPKVGVGEGCSEVNLSVSGGGDMIGPKKYKSCQCPEEFTQCFNGPEIGANSCTEGSVTKHDQCLAECPEKCDYTICPKGYVCEYEQCSNRYCPTGCEIGTSYVNLNDYWCHQSLKCFFKSDDVDEYGLSPYSVK